MATDFSQLTSHRALIRFIIFGSKTLSRFPIEQLKDHLHKSQPSRRCRLILSRLEFPIHLECSPGRDKQTNLNRKTLGFVARVTAPCLMLRVEICKIACQTGLTLCSSFIRDLASGDVTREKISVWISFSNPFRNTATKSAATELSTRPHPWWIWNR